MNRAVKKIFIVLFVFPALLFISPVKAYNNSDIDSKLAEGLRLIEEEIDYNAALEVFRAILVSPSASEEQITEARLQAAFCLVALDHMEEANDFLVQVLMKRPDYTLPPYSSPKLRDAVDKARREADAKLAQLELERAFDDESEVTTPDYELLQPVQASAQRASWWPWYSLTGGSALAVIGTGVYFGMESQKAEARLHDEPETFSSQNEALEYRDAAIRDARTANILLISGAILTVGTGVLAYLDGTRPAISNTPSNDGFMLTLTGSW